MSKFFIALCLLASLWGAKASGQAANVYITQTGATAGICTSSVQSAAWFNNSANWGTGSTQIGPDTIVHACGAFTQVNYTTPGLAFRASGTAGHPITLRAEAGFDLAAPVWGTLGNAAITSYGFSHIVIDLNNVGIIENTANGTGLANQLNSTGIYVQSATDVTIKNGTVRNICVYSGGAICGTSSNDTAILLQSGVTNSLITNMTVHDSYECIAHVEGTGGTVTMTHNTTYHCNWGIVSATSGGTDSITGDVIAFNDISDAYTWDPSGAHHNGIFIYNGGGSAQENNEVLNSNYVHGNMGTSNTGYIFLDPNATGSVGNPTIINNILCTTSVNSPGNAFITGVGQSTGKIYNNTICGNGNVNSANEGGIATNFGASGATLENNIIQGVTNYLYLNNPASLALSDYNIYYAVTTAGHDFWDQTTYRTFANWQATYPAFDTHSAVGNPLLNSAFVPQTGSAAIGACKNLTSLGIAALNVDYNGNARPSTGPWDCGAVNSGGGAPATPTNISIVVVGP